MISRIFPEHADNRFRGPAVAIWLLIPITLMRIGISLLHILSADGGAQSVSTMPLDRYPAGAAQNVIALMARMGLDQLMLGLMVVVVLLRYRALIPLMYVLLVVQVIGGEAIATMKPLSLAATSGATVPALVLSMMSVVGLVLSLVDRSGRSPRASGAR
jgi:hypothetical protein